MPAAKGAHVAAVCVSLTLHTQAAVAAANADPEGGVVYLPAGTYLLDSTLVVERANVVLRGDGVSCGGVVWGAACGVAPPASWAPAGRQRWQRYGSAGGGPRLPAPKRLSWRHPPRLLASAGKRHHHLYPQLPQRRVYWHLGQHQR